MERLAELAQGRGKWSTIKYNAAVLGMQHQQRQWQQQRPAASAGERGGKCLRAVELLAQMATRGGELNTITFKVAVLVCARGGEWRHSEELMAGMVAWHSITYNAVVLDMQQQRM